VPVLFRAIGLGLTALNLHRTGLKPALQPLQR
jgi:hypothetical protein